LFHALRSYQPSSGGRMGVMAGSSGLGLWFITLGNVAGALHAPVSFAHLALLRLTHALLPCTHAAAHGGYFDNIVLTLTDANNVAHAYPLPLSTEIVALPSAGSLFGALPSGAQGPAVASTFATFSGTR
jgi:hypothetical protein